LQINPCVGEKWEGKFQELAEEYGQFCTAKMNVKGYGKNIDHIC
jgi:hypothetical protein